LNKGKRIIPTITFGNGSFLVEPSNAALAEKLGLSTQDPHEFHDVTVIGAGPAGLTCAIYNARDGFSVMVIDEGALGGQQPNTAFLQNSGLILDDHGFILTGHALTHHPTWPAGQDPPEILATNLPGVFAGGDVRAGSTKQVASASGEGATAALLIREYLHST
jgi:thioredoxin reductase